MVSGLSKTTPARRLLRQVGNEPYATADDHDDPSRTAQSNAGIGSSDKRDPTVNEADINADPISDDDESAPPTQPRGFRPPPSSAASLLNSTVPAKRGKDDEDDALIFGTANTQNKIFRKPLTAKNIHAPVPTAKKKLTQYGKKAVPKPKMLVGKERRFRPPRGKGVEQESFAKVSVKPSFKSVSGVIPRVDLARDELSEEASLAADVAELDESELVALSQDICHVCEEPVNSYVRELFEDRYDCTVQSNYRSAQRFCKFHRQQDALQVWEENGYPDIDWVRLSSRLNTTARTKRLRSILDGERRALFQDTQEGHVKSRKRTALQALGGQEDGKELQSVGGGYYGPRGEKLIVDYILQNFSDKLRMRAAKERVITTAGISGGISGYVQAILAPELIVSLIAEDLDQDEDAAMRIISETNALGELLHPEGGVEMEVKSDMYPSDE